MFQVFFLIVCCVPVCLSAQLKEKRDYFDSNWKKCDSVSAHYITSYTYRDSIGGSIQTKDSKGQLVSECSYSDIESSLREGNSSFYFENGVLKSTGFYKDNQFEGEFRTFYSNAQVKRIDFYTDGKLVSGKCFTASGADTTYYAYESKPEYSGGTEALYRYISKSVVYPKNARKKGISGRVIVQFTIQKDGSVADVRVAKSIHTLLDTEAIRVISAMPHWQPGTQDGEAVSVKYAIPIGFSLK